MTVFYSPVIGIFLYIDQLSVNVNANLLALVFIAENTLPSNSNRRSKHKVWTGKDSFLLEVIVFGYGDENGSIDHMCREFHWR